jgi:hypothetical protein
VSSVIHPGPYKPVEIQVGGRSVVNSDIEQIVEMRPDEDRFLRMLELLGEWYEQVGTGRMVLATSYDVV